MSKPKEEKNEDLELLEGVLEEEEETDAVDEVAPEYGSGEWQDYVISLFREDEKTNDFPNINGLRRVGQQILANIYGTVVDSNIEILDTPSEYNGGRYAVKSTITFNSNSSFSDVADVCNENTEVTYAKHPTSTAATKAEARIWRKLLLISKPAAEEVVNVPEFEENSDPDRPCTSTQKTCITMNCQQLNIEVEDILKLSKNQYKSLDEVKYDDASKMVKTLSNLKNIVQDEKAKVPKYLQELVDKIKETL